MGNGITWRVISPKDRKDCDEVYDPAFSLRGDEHYLDYFPIWNPELAPVHSRIQMGGWIDGQLVSTASLRVCDYRFSDGTQIKLGLIGAVATREGFTGRGYASEVLDRFIAEGRANGVSSFALWGPESSLYSKRGFTFGGIQMRTPVSVVTVSGECIGDAVLKRGWSQAIFEKLKNRSEGIRYSDNDLTWISHQQGVEWRTLWVGDQCVAYAGWNRGIDLPNMIHELDGTPEGVRTIFSAIQKEHPELELLHHLKHEAIGISSAGAPEFLAQFSFGPEVINPEAVLNEIWFSGLDSC